MKVSGISNSNVKALNAKGDISVYDYNQLFDNLSDGVCIINEYGHISYFNNSYIRILKISEPIGVGKNIFHMKHDCAILDAFRDRRSTRGRLIQPATSKHITVSVSPIFTEYVFKGVLAIYREELANERREERGTVVEFNGPSSPCALEMHDCFNEIVAKSRIIKEALLIAEKASKTSSTVLLRGESGTGKEMVAKAIHKGSSRSHAPFITVNCGAIPGTLLESELFGHEQGAFTGALKRKLGKFEQADGGTIFLDEVGDMPNEMQVKLLRVLQERKFERVGGNETIHCDVRIIAATHKNLEEAIEIGTFREDLYYRLNVIPIYLPSLKKRREDIPILIEHFVKKTNSRIGTNIKGFSEEASDCFYNYHWPGNVRELENLIERMMVLCDGNYIELKDLPSHISNLYQVREGGGGQSLVNLTENGEIATLEEYEREILRCALKRFGSFNATGKALGINHKTVAFKARKYNIVDDINYEKFV